MIEQARIRDRAGCRNRRATLPRLAAGLAVGLLLLCAEAAPLAADELKVIVFANYPQPQLETDDRDYLRILSGQVLGHLERRGYLYFDPSQEATSEDGILTEKKPKVLITVKLTAHPGRGYFIELQIYRVEYQNGGSPNRRELFVRPFLIALGTNKTMDAHIARIDEDVLWGFDRRLVRILNRDPGKLVFGNCISPSNVDETVPEWIRKYVRDVTPIYHRKLLSTELGENFVISGVEDDDYEYLCARKRRKLGMLEGIYGHILSGSVRQAFGTKLLRLYWTERNHRSRMQEIQVSLDSLDAAVDQIVQGVLELAPDGDPP